LRAARLIPAVLAILAALGGATGPGRGNAETPEAEESVVAALSQTRVAITTDFSGSEIFIYGAIKRFARPPEGAPLDIVITITGPSEPVMVRKKERRLGIWVNGPGVQVDAAPSFYAVSSTGPFREVMSWTDDLRYHVGIDQIVRLIGNPQDTAYPEEYRRAVIRLRRDQGLYFERPGGVTVTDETLFQTRVALPANLVEGDYRARVFLVRERTVVDVFEKAIAVRKVGLERWVHVMATEHSALYGILSIAVALAAGWIASTVFRYILP